MLLFRDFLRIVLTESLRMEYNVCEVYDQAKEKNVFIVDSHCDSIARVADGTYGVVNPYNFSTRCPQLQFMALFTSWEGMSAEDSYRRTLEYIGHFAIAMEKERDKVSWVRSFADIERAFSEGKHAALLTMESGTGLMGSTQILRDFYAAGVRVMGLTWLTNDLAKSNRLSDGEKDTGLTDVGREIVREGNRLGMIFDVSHASDNTFWNLAEYSEKPIVATHSNFRSLCGHSRNLTDEMAREIIRRDGMIGLNLCRKFIHDEKTEATAANLFGHLDHMMSLGGEDHVGFGCDIDGIGGDYPPPLGTERSIHDQLIELMLRHNYPEALVKKTAGENCLTFLKKYL